MKEFLSNNDAEWNGFVYEVEDGSVIIQKYRGSEKELVVPSNIHGCAVREFNMCEFWSDPSPYVEHITLPGTIRDFNFGERSCLRTVRIEPGCAIVPDRAFSEMSHLEIVDLPDTIEEIGSDAFCGCRSLKYVRIPEGCKIIGDSAFAFCGLDRLYLPKSVITLGRNPFCGCDTLRLYLHPENPHFTHVNGMVLYTSDFSRLIRCHPSYPDILEVPECLEFVDPLALMGCELYGFNIPEKCNAFSGIELKYYSM